jgi:hypothetical protein
MINLLEVIEQLLRYPTLGLELEALLAHTGARGCSVRADRLDDLVELDVEALREFVVREQRAAEAATAAVHLLSVATLRPVADITGPGGRLHRNTHPRAVLDALDRLQPGGPGWAFFRLLTAAKQMALMAPMMRSTAYWPRSRAVTWTTDSGPPSPDAWPCRPPTPYRDRQGRERRCCWRS